MRRLIILAFLLSQDVSRVKVVTTYGFLRYAAEQVGKGRVEAEALAHPRQDPHAVVPVPEMQRKAYGANLFVALGRSLDLWAKNVLDASGNPKIQPGTAGFVIASVNCPLEELPGDVSRERGDVHPEGNPHVWLDPLNMKIIAANIAEGLKRVDPAGTEIYDRGLAEFKGRIDRALFGEELVKAVGEKRIATLERRLRSGELFDYLRERGLEEKLGGWLLRSRPLRGLKVVSYHKSFTYFAKVFGIEIVAELEPRPGTEPKPQDRDRVVEAIRRHGIRVILHENYYSTAASDYVAGQTGAKVVKAYLDVGGSGEVADYFGLIDRLVNQILEATK